MIKVLLFAHLKEQAGRSEMDINCEKMTVAELRQALAEKGILHQDAVMVAVNEEFARDEEMVHSGDTVALIPPVSGG
ncbi:molybdopterin converting factor subunit 1 [Weizmannia sp. CD-2023]|uniref:molybdopterin converting factor subunit 1 n=1 Tax=Heyndrickxia TaxID=2837504 RepID=UPI002E1D317C|nr:molybdopterin converting factor subunit 1 [Weizmannia sp. CD-2023]MED4839042.1 molybdopterin converting factor subunit 1 [Weizmannia sp. CD-2023]MED4902269.1 molybdopterin converting factor subunit 1 [Weizmannia sp. CD-2023]